MTAATPATATTASAVVILMSRSVTGTVPRASRDERVIVAVAGGQAFGEGQCRDRLVAAEQPRGRADTIHAPLPSAAACWLNRAVATTAPSTQGP